jgi:hypothetical protein
MEVCDRELFQAFEVSRAQALCLKKKVDLEEGGYEFEEKIDYSKPLADVKIQLEATDRLARIQGLLEDGAGHDQDQLLDLARALIAAPVPRGISLADTKPPNET